MEQFLPHFMPVLEPPVLEEFLAVVRCKHHECGIQDAFRFQCFEQSSELLVHERHLFIVSRNDEVLVCGR